MANATSYLVISTIPKSAMQEKLHSNLSQAMPLAMAAGGRPLGRYMATQQLVGEGGPTLIASIEFANDQAISDMVNSPEFAALGALRSEVFERLGMIICTAMKPPKPTPPASEKSPFLQAMAC